MNKKTKTKTTNNENEMKNTNTETLAPDFFETLNGPELVRWFNIHTPTPEKKVARFASRAAGIKRCEKLAKELGYFEAPKPKKAGGKARAKMNKYTEAAKLEIESRERIASSKKTGKKKSAKARAEEIATRCERLEEEVADNKIAASWRRADVYAKRATRHSVTVLSDDGAGAVIGVYPSVAEAFRTLDLPMGQHIRFRMKLKAAGTLSGYDMKWQINEPQKIQSTWRTSNE